MTAADRPVSRGKPADIFPEADRLVPRPFRDEAFSDFLVFSVDPERLRLPDAGEEAAPTDVSLRSGGKEKMA